MHIDRFDSVEHLFASRPGRKRKRPTYEELKEAVLKAGRFSCFEASVEGRGDMFTRLMQDPDIEKVEMGYPWIGVKRREKT